MCASTASKHSLCLAPPPAPFAPVQIHIHSLAPYKQHEVRALATSHAPDQPRLSRHSCAQSTIVIVTPQVHGVLGQRAISPAPMTQPPVEQPGGGEGQRTLAALDTTTFSAALGLGGGGVGTSTTVRAAVQVDGRLQGEGAIVGSYRDYQASAPRMYSSSVSVCQSFRCQSCLCVCPTPHHNSLHAYYSFPLLLLQVKWVSSHGPGAFAYSRFTECAGD